MSDGRSVPIHLNPSTHLRFSQPCPSRPVTAMATQGRDRPYRAYYQSTDTLSQTTAKADDEHHSDDGECDRDGDTTDISLRQPCQLNPKLAPPTDLEFTSGVARLTLAVAVVVLLLVQGTNSNLRASMLQSLPTASRADSMTILWISSAWARVYSCSVS